ILHHRSSSLFWLRLRRVSFFPSFSPSGKTESAPMQPLGKSLESLPTFFARMFYGWRMVGLVSAIRILGGGLHNYGFTVFFLPLSQDLGLSRAATSLAFSLARAEGAIEGPFVGYLIDRFGPRPMILVATISWSKERDATLRDAI